MCLLCIQSVNHKFVITLLIWECPVVETKISNKILARIDCHINMTHQTEKHSERAKSEQLFFLFNQFTSVNIHLSLYLCVLSIHNTYLSSYCSWLACYIVDLTMLYCLHLLHSCPAYLDIYDRRKRKSTFVSIEFWLCTVLQDKVFNTFCLGCILF